MTTNANPKSAPPVDEIRAGRLKVVIWKNDGERGAFYTLDAQRVFKDGDEWKTSRSFGADDALPLAELMRQAWSRIQELKRNDREG